MTVQKQFFMYATEKKKYLTKDVFLYPIITTRYNQKRACVLLGCFENNAQATQRAIDKGYIIKDSNGGYKFEVYGILKFISEE